MRWPWERGPWARRTETTDGPSAGSADHPPAPTPAPAPAAATHGPEEWRSLPPVQRSLADAAPSVAPPDSFRDSLVTHHNPSFLAPLGHLVDPEGPSGVVGGLASSGRPITYESGVELRVPDHAPAKPPTPATVQRSMATLRPAASATPQPEAEPIASEPVFSSSPAPEPAAPAVPASTEVRQLAPDPAEIRTATNTGRLADQEVSSVQHPGQPASNPPLVVARLIDPSAPAPLAIQRLAGGEGLDHRDLDQEISDHPVFAHPGRDHAPLDHLASDQPETDHAGPDRPAPSALTPDQSPAVDAAARMVPAVQRAAAGGPDLEVTGTLGATPDRPDAELRAPQPAATTTTPAQSAPGPTALTVPVQRAAAQPGSQAVSGAPAPAPALTLSSGPTAATPTTPAPTDPTPSTPSAGWLLDASAVPPPSDRSERGADPAVPDVPLQRLTDPAASPVDALPAAASVDDGPGDAPMPSAALLADQPLVGSSSSAPTVPLSTPGAELSGPSGATETPLVIPARSAEPPASVQRTASGSTPTLSAGSPTPTVPTGVADVPTVARSLGDRHSLPPAAASLPVDGGAASTDRSRPPLPGPQPDPASGLEPPLLVRSVQRRLEQSASAPAGGPTGGSETAPLSGFAAAISALHEDGSGEPAASPQTPASGDLVVARQVAPSPAPAGRPGSIALSSAGASLAVPALVVARRVAPDESGHLPTAAARVAPLVSASSTTYDGGGRGAGPAAVQRSLIADLPPLIPNAEFAAPQTSPAGATAPPSVQRLRYEDVTGGDRPVPPALEPVVDPLSGSQDGGPVPPGSHGLTAVERPQAAGPVTLSTSGTWPAGPQPSVQRSATVGSPAGPTPTSFPGTQDSFTAPLSPVVPDEPALRVQRQADAAPGPPAPASGSSTRIVGLAEMFAIAAGTPDEPSLQRAAEPAAPVTETSIQLAPDTAAPAAGPAGAGSSAAPAAGASGADLEEMARRLYEPLSARLRAELWQDRERSGLLTDLRP